MTAAAFHSRAPRQTGMKGLAGALTLVCMVLFLLAIEQKQAVEAWAAVRDEAAPAAGRVAVRSLPRRSTTTRTGVGARN